MEKENEGAKVIRPRVLAVRSWMGRLFPYVRLLEALVHDQAEQIALLQDRHERILTGFGLKEEMPNAVEVSQAQEAALRAPRTIEDLRVEKEVESRKRREEHERKAAAAAAVGRVDFQKELDSTKKAN